MTVTLQQQQTLLMTQKITLMVNKYEVRASDDNGTAGPVLAFAQQKRLALKEQVTLYTDESKSQAVAGFKARQVMDLAATYDVTDENGNSIGSFRKDFAKSLLQSTWHLTFPSHGTVTGQERSLPIALLRRFAFSWLPFHFDFAVNGKPIFSVNRQFSLRDKYLIKIQDPTVDRRVVLAMAVALDALQAR